METEKLHMPVKKKETKRALLLGVIAAILAVVVIASLVGGSDTRRLKKQIDRGSSYVQKEDYTQAVNAYGQALEIDPTKAEAYLGLARAYEGAGDYEKELVTLKSGMEQVRDEGEKAQLQSMMTGTIHRLNTNAGKMLARGDAAGAEDLWNLILQYEKTYGKAYIGLAGIEDAAGDYETALSTICTGMENAAKAQDRETLQEMGYRELSQIRALE